MKSFTQADARRTEAAANFIAEQKINIKSFNMF